MNASSNADPSFVQGCDRVEETESEEAKKERQMSFALFQPSKAPLGPRFTVNIFPDRSYSLLVCRYSSVFPSCASNPQRGSLRVVFDSAGKIRELEMYFDPISVWRQMHFASGLDDMPALTPPPNTLRSALQHSEEARVITEAAHPFRITHVNQAWVNLCGFSEEESRGKTLRILQGNDTDAGTVKCLVDDCSAGRPSSMEVVNYDKAGKKFRNFLRVYPLTENNSEGEVSHLLGILKPLGCKYQ